MILDISARLQSVVDKIIHDLAMEVEEASYYLALLANSEKEPIRERILEEIHRRLGD